MKKPMLFILIALLTTSLFACNKKEEVPQVPETAVEAQKTAEANADAQKTAEANAKAQKPTETNTKADEAKVEAKAEEPKDAIKPNEKFNLKTPIVGLVPGDKCEVVDGFCEEFVEEGMTMIAWRKAFKRTATGEATDEEIEKLIPHLIPNKEPKDVVYTLSEPISELSKRPAWSVVFTTGGNEDMRQVKATVTADEHYLYAYIVSRSEHSSIEELTVTKALMEIVF